ncbi:restriction endonuclease subunit S [Clostridium perfringens]|uniref:Type I restriction modification DNA specificity domain-containing protein n=1 Tax=Clostridium perfringens TaxID=1502 RepID=A0AAW9IP29_CLOPF|nr:restriction endonuclease subunit S [Clostridium perfringens]MDZ5031620.1 hypothetical protein [Clostridium perfringens]
MKKEVREGYKITELGEIPNEWDIVALGEIGEFKNGINKSKEDFGFGCKFVNIQDAYYGNIVKNDLLERINVNDKEKEIYKLENDDIILVRSSVKPEGVGYPILFKKENEDIVYCGFMIRYRYDKRKINPIFLLYQLRSENIRKRVLDLSTVSANTNINQDSYKQIKISIPSIKEQEKIAEILSTVDEQIENTEKLIQKNQELKKGLMQQLLTKGIGHTEFNKTEFGDIPKEWSVISSNKVFNVITDYVANGSFADLAKNVEYKEYEEYAILVRLTDYKNNYKGPFIYVDKNAYDFLGKSKLEENDIIISNVGAYAGYVFRAPSIKKPITLGPNAILVRSNENRDFLYYWLSSDIGQKKIREIISTTAQPKFNKTDFKKIKLPIPSLDEQEKIALILSSIDKKIEQDKYKKEKLEEVKKGLMQNLLTGKLRVI